MSRNSKQKLSERLVEILLERKDNVLEGCSPQIPTLSSLQSHSLSLNTSSDIFCCRFGTDIEPYLSYSVQATVSNCHRLGGLNNKYSFCIVMESGPRSRY